MTKLLFLRDFSPSQELSQLGLQEILLNTGLWSRQGLAGGSIAGRNRAGRSRADRRRTGRKMLDRSREDWNWALKSMEGKTMEGRNMADSWWSRQAEEDQEEGVEPFGELLKSREHRNKHMKADRKQI